MRMIGQGAEAKVFETEFLGRNAIMKSRPAKEYRHPELDRQLRTQRTKNEVRAIRETRAARIRTPVIYDIDMTECSITMEHMNGRTVKDILTEEPDNAVTICKKVGMTIARLHDHGISHGDLTTSNMIITDSGEMCLIDLSLGNTTADIEDIGVDMHLLKRAFTSAHSDLEDAFNALLDEYRNNMDHADEVFAKVEDIRNRGRYT